eukprot:824420_1
MYHCYKLLSIIIIFSSIITYLIGMILVFDKLPSLHQIWTGINYGITLIQRGKYDYSEEIKALNIYTFNASDPYDSLSYDVIRPWIYRQAKLEYKKKLSTLMRRDASNNKKYTPWNKQCPLDMHNKIRRDQTFHLNMYTPAMDYVNFTALKSQFRHFVSTQHPLTQDNASNIINNTKLEQCKYKGKVFGIGMFKTGTTSLSLALSFLGYIDNTRSSQYQQLKEYPCNYGHWYLILRQYYDLMNSLININDKAILNDVIKRSKTSYNFGDFPMLYFWRLFDVWYPSSKFILTVRSSTARFVNSVMSFCIQLEECMQFGSKSMGTNRSDISIEQYRWNEYDDINGMDLAHYIAMIYELHNERVIEYFSSKILGSGKDLLILDIDATSNANKWKHIMDFVGCDNETIVKYVKYPHVNPTRNEMKAVYMLLPNDYDLDWKQYFGHKLPIMRTQHEPYRKIWFEYRDYKYTDLV